MKAVILLAGLGSRLQPLTITTPKSLLPIGNSNTLEHMVSKLIRHKVSSFVIVCGYMQKEIQEYLKKVFSFLDVTVVTNKYYKTTNTGYSLMLAREYLKGETFIKLDGDVIFDEKIIGKLVAAKDDCSYVCVDSTAVDEEVIKVQCNALGNITRIGNKLPVASAVSESIGIERISKRSSVALFSMLEKMMDNSDNHQNYYEIAYDAIIQLGEPFKVINVTGLRWVEIDTLNDYNLAKHYFGSATA